MSILSPSSRLTFLTSRMPNAATSDEYLPLHSPVSSPTSSPSSSTPSTPPSSPKLSSHPLRRLPSFMTTRTRLHASGGLPFPISLPKPACTPRKLYTAFLALVALILLSTYIIFFTAPTLAPALAPLTVNDHPANPLENHQHPHLAFKPKHRQHVHHSGKAHPPISEPDTPSNELALTPAQELAAITSFLTSLHDKHINILPSTVNPSQPIDPQLVLDFDLHRNAHAKEELEAMEEDVWTRNPVVVYAKHFSPVSRAIKSTFNALHLHPPPTYIDIDTRTDAHVLKPLLERLTGMEMPVILIGGEALRPPAANEESPTLKYILDSDSSSSPPAQMKKYDTSVLEYVQELERMGELAEMLNRVGVVIGGAKGHGRRGRSL